MGRLDKDVSGIMVYAKNQPSAARLSKQRSQEVLHKVYDAVAQGIFENSSGTLQYGLRKVEGRKDRKKSRYLRPQTALKAKSPARALRCIGLKSRK